MSKRGTYAVRITGMGEGDHDFSFELDRSFFALFEQSEITDGEVHAGVVLEKKPGVLALHFHIKGKVEVTCDRCLEPFLTEIESIQDIFLKIGDNPGELEDDVVVITRDDHEIEVGQWLYEYIVLALPYQKVHPASEQGVPRCDPDMLKKLDEYAARKAHDGQQDPRWDALKGIIEKDN